MSVTLDEAAGMLRDMMPALIEQEETLIETLCASVCSGAGSFTAFQLVHKLVTEGLLPNAMAGIALRLQERVLHVQNAPAAAQDDAQVVADALRAEPLAQPRVDARDAPRAPRGGRLVRVCRPRRGLRRAHLMELV